MEDGSWINCIHWNMKELRLADLYKLFIGDFNSKKEFQDAINEIIEKRHNKIKLENELNLAKRWMEE